MTCGEVIIVGDKKTLNCTLTCGRFSPRWCRQSAACRSSLAASDQSSMPAPSPMNDVTFKYIIRVNYLKRTIKVRIGLNLTR